MAGEYQPITVSRRISAPAREIFQLLADIGNGTIWVDSMHRTLERLDQLCARP